MNLPLIVSILLFVGAAQGFLLAAALISLRRGNVTANRILAGLLLAFSLTIFFHTLGQFQLQSEVRAQNAWVGHAVFLLFGPLMYLYAKALTARSFTMSRESALHFMPFVTFVVLYLLLRGLALPPIYSVVLGNLLFVFMVVQMLWYLFAVLKILKEHGSRIRESFSSLERVNLHWLRFLTIGQIVIWSVAFVVEVMKRDPREINVVWLLVSAFMYMVGYFGISQPEIFTVRVEEGESTAEAGRKYGKSALSAEQSQQILKRLESLMMTGKPHLNSGLTLPLLSKQLSVPTYHLSQVINQQLGKNFFEYINQYRVEEAKRLLVDPKMQNLTLASIGFESGFNSVSSFNSIFKKMTSMTPSSYRASTEAGNPQPAK